MTAEVAIANGGAVALAADSAVTIGGRKIYNSAIKLFSFSKVHPVGIMIYGNANLLEIPWETLIKTCRESLLDKKFDVLEEYGKYFIDYLKENGQFFSEESQVHWVCSNVRAYFGLIRDELFEKVHILVKEKGEAESTEINGILADIISTHHNQLKKESLVNDIDEKFEKEFRKKFKKYFSEILEEIFQNLEIEKALVSKLDDIATFLQTRSIYPSGTSGIVISGFGEKEIFPSILTFEIEGYISGRLKYRKIDDKCYKVRSGNDCSIVAFAQEDMVAAFMNGMNPSVTDLINYYLNHIFDRLPELLLDDDLDGSKVSAQAIRSGLRKNAESLHKDFIDTIRKHVRDEHVSPVLNMVTVLPKDELAAMAESLVSLTAFKRRMTESLETVGGPIDVAVISKGDGLVWVKRKLYFPKELNGTFFENYFRRIENGKG